MKQKILKIIYNIFAKYANIYLRRTKPEVIGVTGSVGKTSARMIITKVLEQSLDNHIIYTSPKNYNSELGLVFSVFQVEKYSPSILGLIKLLIVLGFKSLFKPKVYDILVLEYGIDKPGDMDHLIKIIKPDIAVFTKLDYIHVENFSGKDAVGQEKMKLLENADIKFLNYHDGFQRSYFENLKPEKYFYNTSPIDFTYVKTNTSITTEFEISDGTKISTNLLGSENFVYIALAIEILKKLGFEYKKDNTFFDIKMQNGRFSVLKGVFDSIIIDSSYNAGSESMKKMIENTITLRDDLYEDREIIYVLGDMRETGDASQKLHFELYSLASQTGEIISVGKETNDFFGPHLGNFKYSKEAGEFLRKYLSSNLDKKYIILFKGSQNTIFLEEAIKQVLQNKNDINKLVRQESYWNKENF